MIEDPARMIRELAMPRLVMEVVSGYGYVIDALQAGRIRISVVHTNTPDSMSVREAGDFLRKMRNNLDK